MPETRRTFDRDFQQGTVRLVLGTRKPIAQVAARDLGVHQGTLGNWVGKVRAQENGTAPLSEDDRAELTRLRREIVELRMQRDVLIGGVGGGTGSRCGRLVMS